MKRLIWLLLIGVAIGQTTVAPNTTVFPATTLFKGVAKGALVQHVKNVACTTASCATTVTSTTAGNLLVAYSSIRYGTVGFATIMDLTSVTDNGTTETWTHCPNSKVNDAFSSDATLYAMDCWYVLSALGGATSVTMNWTVAGLTSPAIKVDTDIYEYSHPGSVFYDTGNAYVSSSSCSNCVGPYGLLSGGADVIFQGAVYPSISYASGITGAVGLYNTVFDNDIGANVIFSAFSGAVEQTSYTVPTWISAASGSTQYTSFAAFGPNASPALTANLYIDYAQCTSAVAPTTTCMGASTTTGWATGQDASPMGANVTITASGITNIIPSATTVNGVSETGSGSKVFHGVTNVGGNGIGKYDVTLGSGQYANLTVGYTVKSSCAAAGDCGALLRLTSNSDYAVAHASPLGNGKWCLESSNGGGCVDTGATYAANTEYRINVLMSGINGNLDKMTVCNASTGAVLGTATAASSLTTNGVNGIEIGINGEEPTTAGYTYDFGPVVVGGTYSTTSCF